MLPPPIPVYPTFFPVLEIASFLFYPGINGTPDYDQSRCCLPIDRLPSIFSQMFYDRNFFRICRTLPNKHDRVHPSFSSGFPTSRLECRSIPPRSFPAELSPPEDLLEDYPHLPLPPFFLVFCLSPVSLVVSRDALTAVPSSPSPNATMIFH